MKEVELRNYAFGSGEGLHQQIWPDRPCKRHGEPGNHDQVTVMQTKKELLGRALNQSSPQQFLKIREQQRTWGTGEPWPGHGDADKEGIAGASFQDERATLWRWSSRSRTNPQQPWQCPWSLGRPSYKEGSAGASLENQRAAEQHFSTDHPEVALTLLSLGNAHGALGDYRRRNCWGELWFKARPSNSWRSEGSTSVLTIQKLQQLSTTSAMPMEPWGTIVQRRKCWSELWRYLHGILWSWPSTCGLCPEEFWCCVISPLKSIELNVYILTLWCSFRKFVLGFLIGNKAWDTTFRQSFFASCHLPPNFIVLQSYTVFASNTGNPLGRRMVGGTK